jgi:threonine/homoserine/homoserine lactone efflux protein
MAWLALLAATEGHKRGFAAVAGVALGLALVRALDALGLAALIEASPIAGEVLHVGGMIYLLWLALQAWSVVEKDAGARMGQTPWRYFRQGLITNLLNPKAAVFYITILPGFLPVAPSLVQTLSFRPSMSVWPRRCMGSAWRVRGQHRDFCPTRTASPLLGGAAIWLFSRT